MWSSGHRGRHGHGHLLQGLLVGILPHRLMATVTSIYVI